MSSVKRYHPHHPHLDDHDVVLASDYDKLACMVEVGHKLAMDAACGEIAALEAERDELRAQVEAMRAALENAAKRAALQAKP